MRGKFLPADFSETAMVDLRKSANLEGNYCQQILVNLQWQICKLGGEFLPADFSKSTVVD